MVLAKTANISLSCSRTTLDANGSRHYWM